MLVSIDAPTERERIEEIAAQLGIQDALVDGRLRRAQARCVFQDLGGACRIHQAFGAAAKPATCQQFPLVVLQTEAGPRAGIDPCCFHAQGQGTSAPALSAEGLPARRVSFEPWQAEDERRLLEVLDAGDASLFRVLGWLRSDGVDSDAQAPPAMLTAWVHALQRAQLQRFLDPDIAGVVLRRSLGPAFGAIPRLDPARPPPWPTLEGDAQAGVVAALRSLVFLRVCSTAIPSVRDVAAVGVLGAALLAWHDPAPSALETGLAGWFRLMRAPQFSRALLMGGPLVTTA